jgi:Leucine-rich repeat (LRR) protein
MSGCAHLRGLPESTMKLQSLSHLNLSLACLCGLTALQHLDISHSRDSYHNDLLVDLPNLTNNLKYLSLSHFYTLRYFTSHHKDLLDDFISTLTNLEHLDLSRNFKLAYLPKSIGNLKRLRTLDPS